MQFSTYLKVPLDVDKAYKLYIDYIKSPSPSIRDELVETMCPIVSHLCNKSFDRSPNDPDFDDYCAEALERLVTVFGKSPEMCKADPSKILPSVRDFRRFFYRCIINSFINSYQRGKVFKSFVPSYPQVCFVRYKSSPRFNVDYAMFMDGVVPGMLSFLKEHNRLNLSEDVLMYFVQSTTSGDPRDSKIDVLSNIFHVGNPCFVKQYVELMMRIYLYLERENYGTDEVAEYVDFLNDGDLNEGERA